MSRYYPHKDESTSILVSDLRICLSKCVIDESQLPSNIKNLINDYERPSIQLGLSESKNPGNTLSIEDWVNRLSSYLAKCFEYYPDKKTGPNAKVKDANIMPKLVRALTNHLNNITDKLSKNVSTKAMSKLNKEIAIIDEKLISLQEELNSREQANKVLQDQLHKLQEENSEAKATSQNLEKRVRELEEEVVKKKARTNSSDSSSSSTKKEEDNLLAAMDPVDLMSRSYQTSIASASVAKASASKLLKQRNDISYFIPPYLMLMIDLRWLAHKILNPKNLTYRLPQDAAKQFVVADELSKYLSEKPKAYQPKTVFYDIPLEKILQNVVTIPENLSAYADLINELALLAIFEILQPEHLLDKNKFRQLQTLLTTPKPIPDTIYDFFTQLNSIADCLFSNNQQYFCGIPKPESTKDINDLNELAAIIKKTQKIPECYKSERHYAGELKGHLKTKLVKLQAQYKQTSTAAATRYQEIYEAKKTKKKPQSTHAKLSITTRTKPNSSSLPPVTEQSSVSSSSTQPST